MTVQFAGNLGKDATVFEHNGKKGLRFTVADTVRVGNENKTTWITCFYHNADLAPYLTKGRAVMVDGDLTVTLNDRSELDYTCRVHYVKLMGKKEDGEQQQP